MDKKKLYTHTHTHTHIYIYIYIHTGYYSAIKKEEIWQAWMDLEGINLNEVSQMDKYHIIILIFSIKNEKKKGKTHT